VGSEPENKRPAASFAGIPVRGWIGLAVIIAFIVAMMAAPVLRWFFVLSVPPGLLIAGMLYFVNRRQEGRNLYARRDSPEDLDEHPGIRIHRIPVKSWVGLVFAVGVMLLFFIALPAIRWFFLLTLPVGILFGVALYLLHRR
jgi:L-asparagine transporter-like permease